MPHLFRSEGGRGGSSQPKSREGPRRARLSRGKTANDYPKLATLFAFCVILLDFCYWFGDKLLVNGRKAGADGGWTARVASATVESTVPKSRRRIARSGIRRAENISRGRDKGR